MNPDVHIVCPACMTVNRLKRDRLTDHPKCGRCKEALFTAHPVTLTQENFQTQISRNDIPVVVDFWAPWCGPCRMMAPAFESAAAQLEPWVRCAKLNTDSEPALAGQYGIQSIPTLMLFQDGREVARQAGAMDLRTLLAWVRGHTTRSAHV